MFELAARAAQVLAAVGGAYLIALWFVLIVWTYRDIESRSSNVFTQIFSTLLVVLFFIPGVLLYLLLRPKQTLDEAFQRSLEEEYLLQDLEDLRLCPGCHRPVEADYVLCPQCQAQLREPCGGCGRLVDVKWPVCPYCALPQKERGDAVPKVAPPPARFIAPSVRKRRERGEQVAAGAVTAPLPAATAGPTSATPAVDGAVPPAARPFDRFRPRQPAAVMPAARTDRDPLATHGSVGDELLRSLEQREAAPPIAPVAAPPASSLPGPAPAADGRAAARPVGTGADATPGPATPPTGPRDPLGQGS